MLIGYHKVHNILPQDSGNIDNAFALLYSLIDEHISSPTLRRILHKATAGGNSKYKTVAELIADLERYCQEKARVENPLLTCV